LGDAADEHAARAVELAEAAHDRREAGNGLVVLALIRRETDRTEAKRIAELAVANHREIGAPFELATTLESLAALVGESSRGNMSEIYLAESLAIYERFGAEDAVHRVQQRLRAPELVRAPSRPRPSWSGVAPLVTGDPQLQAVIEAARELGSIDRTVLIEGETGTGKELVAQIIHESGTRAAKPFVPINCAEFTASLLESELFGHRKGSFTGATSAHRGVLESARDGTVFLDEIDKASPDLQAKLLRVIEGRKVRPVGSSELVELEARILVATNRDLRALADRGEFLADLYYRLSTFRLVLPALRDRPGDVSLLASHFLANCVGDICPGPLEISPSTLSILCAYPWPGNVRELRNVIESAAFAARTDNAIEPQHLPTELRDAAPIVDEEDSLPARIASFERRHILDAMRRAGGVKTEAARVLGVSRKGLLDRIRRLGLEE